MKVKVRVLVDSKHLVRNHIYDAEEMIFDGKIIAYNISNGTILGANLVDVIKEVASFETSIGKKVIIEYSIVDEKLPYKRTIGIIENIGGNKVWINNKNGCLECFRFSEIMQMTEVK